MANTDNDGRATGQTPSREPDGPHARQPSDTPDDATHPQESDASITPPHGDPVLDASEHADRRESDDKSPDAPGK